MIEIKGNIIERDGEAIGKVVDGKAAVAAGTHWKTKEAIAAATNLEVIEDTSSEPTPEPPAMDYRGDKTPDYVEWYRAAHTNEEFQRKYAGRKLA